MERDKQTLPLHEDKRPRLSINVKVKGGCRTIECFENFEQIGEGTYGRVFRARAKETKELVALKKLQLENEQEGFPLTAIREIKILKKLRHENVVSLKEIVTSRDLSAEKREVYMVFEYMDHDLSGLMHRENWNPTVPHIKCYMKQLLNGLHHCHTNKVLHRDIKPSNLLISNRGELKLADFGLARPYVEDGHFTNKVVTLWYRPPELLLGTSKYGPEVDIWSAGCILVELLTGRAVFTGKTDLEQLDAIFRLCGVPDKESWADVDKMPFWGTYKPNKESHRCLSEWLKRKCPNITKETLDLAERMLTLDPAKRITISEALDHDFFWTFPEPAKPSDLPRFPSTHEFTSKKRRQEQQQSQNIHQQSQNIHQQHQVDSHKKQKGLSGAPVSNSTHAPSRYPSTAQPQRNSQVNSSNAKHPPQPGSLPNVRPSSQGNHNQGRPSSAGSNQGKPVASSTIQGSRPPLASNGGGRAPPPPTNTQTIGHRTDKTK